MFFLQDNERELLNWILDEDTWDGDFGMDWELAIVDLRGGGG